MCALINQRLAYFIISLSNTACNSPAHTPLNVKLTIRTIRRILLDPCSIRLFFEVHLNHPFEIRLSIPKFQSGFFDFVSINILIDNTRSLAENTSRFCAVILETLDVSDLI